MGEDPEHEKNQSSESHNRKLQLTLFHQVPMVYNAAQHEVTDTARGTSGLNQTFVSPTDYDKLCMSLLCGLPNEQELALNVCTILSNEGNYMLHLEQCPKLVDLLIAQAGIWNLADSSLKMLYLESWKGLRGRNVYRFWRSCLDLKNTQLVQLLGLDLGTHDPDAELLNLESDLGALNPEGQRVLRVALILHNLSFEKNNVPVLVCNTNFIRFLLLCTHSSWSNLKQTAFDTLSNVSGQIKLSIEKDMCSRILFQTVMDGILSLDRYMNIRSMDVLSQLCNYEPNEDIIPSRLDVEVYQKMVSFLTVHDIMLLFYTLEALYALSDLGRYACDKIVSVHRCIGVLVSLLTLEPNQYSTSGHIKMKIVETLVPVEVDEHEVKTDATSSSGFSNDVDSETFASNWLKSSFEVAPGSMVPRNEIYAEYVNFCGKAGRKGVVNAGVFASIVKSLFPQCGLKRTESGSGVITFHHDGLRRRKIMTSQTGPPHSKSSNITPRKVPSSSATCKSGQKPTYSPILKAQLSAPPRSGVTSPPLKRPQNVPNGRKCVSPVPASSQNNLSTVQASPNAPGSSTLIKSLLANKVQQRNLHRQVVPQNVSKMVVYSPDKGPSLSQGVVGSSSTTVMRCVRPGGLSQIIRTPVQARFVSNKSRILSSTAPSRVIKSTALLSPKVAKQNVMMTSSTPRLNGIQKDVQMEVCSQDDDSKSNEATYTQVMQMNCVQNHVNSDSSFDTKDSMSMSCDGDSMFSSKSTDLNSESNKNFTFSQIQNNSVTCKLTGTNELPETSENLMLVNSKPSTDGLSPPAKEQQNGSSIVFVNNNFVEDSSLSSQSSVEPKISSPTNILKSVLNDMNSEGEDTSKLHIPQKDKISKKAPLLNGLLDKGKANVTVEMQPSPVIQNGSISNPHFEMNSDEIKSSMSSVQSTANQCVTPVSVNAVVPVSLNSSVSPPSTSHSVIPSLNSTSASSSNSVTNASNLNSSVSVSSVNTAVMPATNFNSNEDNLVQICSGQTTLSGTIEVQPDQTGVVRLHIESPENSNQGSDLSSISDITRTLECASQAISRTNTECNTQVPCCGTCETTATVTVITTNTSTLARTGQQFIVVTPALNQPQLHIQSPNIKFRILHSLPRSEEAADPINFPRVNINQISHLRQPTPESPSISTATLKRPSSDVSSVCTATDTKRTRIDTKTPLLEATLRLPTPVPCSVAPSNVTAVASNSVSSVGSNINGKSFQDTQSFLLKNSQIENLGVSTPKLTSAKAVPVQNVDFPNEREVKTFSGLSSASDNPSLNTPSQVPPRSMTSAKLEYFCEWKDCGLKFPNPGSVFLHASKVHTPYCNDDMICQWEGCDSMKRRRFSLLTHLQDWHCNERVLHIQALRRKQLSQQGKTSIAPPQMPPPHPGYAPDAALLAIRRHALQYINPKELSEEKESALTKSIRLTSALILRNLVTHSSLARTYVRRFEPELAYLAMSPVESARTVAQCLSELSRTHD
ncbi:AT-rich interactive domain-containing protein 2-like isoform X2 [Argiope bruennichi]|nr:AT-rich interactive domain-containing protein 2-like isoform X2 [Argiope bruennichi]